MTIEDTLYPITILPGGASLPSRARAEQAQPLGILFHGMSRFFNHDGRQVHASDFLTEIGLSAHAYIEPSGNQIHSVPTKRIAYHAGRSKFKEHTNLNTRWLGVELLVEGVHTIASLKEAMMSGDAYSEDQYKSAAALCVSWMGQHPTIREDHICGHDQVSGKDVRPDPKFDPGPAWNWAIFWEEYYAIKQKGELLT